MTPVTMEREAFICPVCYNNVEQTPGRRIAGHCCNDGADCPGSSQPFSITMPATITKERRERARLLAELRSIQDRSAEIIGLLTLLDQTVSLP